MKKGLKIGLVLVSILVLAGVIYYLVKKNQKPNVSVEKIDKVAKTIQLKVDGKPYTIPFDQGLHLKGFSIERATSNASDADNYTFGVHLKKDGVILETIEI